MAAGLVALHSAAWSGRPIAQQSERTPTPQSYEWPLGLGTPHYHPYQKLKLHLDFQIASGLHVYGRPVPEGYTPLQVEIDPLETLEAGALEMPEPRPFEVEGLEENLHIYEGTIRVSFPLMLLKNLGDVTLKVRVRYQACSDVACFPTGEVLLQLPLAGLDNIRE